MILFFGPPIVVTIMAFSQPFFYPMEHVTNFLLLIMCYITAKGTLFNNQLIRPSPIITDMTGMPGRRVHVENSHSGRKRVLITLNNEYVPPGKEDKRDGWDALNDFVTSNKIIEVIDSADKFIDIPLIEGGPPEGSIIYLGKFFGGSAPKHSFLEAATIKRMDYLVQKQRDYETAIKRLVTQISTLTRESNFTDAGVRDKIHELVEDFGKNTKIAMPNTVPRIPTNPNQRGDPNYPNQPY